MEPERKSRVGKEEKERNLQKRKGPKNL